MQAFLYGVTFVFNTAILVTEILSATGYAMFSFCLLLVLDYVETGQRDFYLGWLTIGFLSSAKLATVLRSRTADKKQGLIVAGVAFATHWIYAYHLHYSYTPADQ
jgi:hypothetical protein